MRAAALASARRIGVLSRPTATGALLANTRCALDFGCRPALRESRYSRSAGEEQAEYVHAAIRAGASGFLLKDVTPAGLVEAIRIVASDDALLAPSVTRRLLKRFATTLPLGDHSSDALAQLTVRETEVLRLLAGGLANAEIASELVVSEATVKTHVSSVLRKLGLRHRVQAVILVYETGVVRLRSAPPK